MVLIKNILAVALAVLALDSQKEDSIAAVNTPSEKDWKEYKTGLKNLSGLSFNQDQSALLAITDKGSIYEINFEGKIKRQLPFDEFGDFEAIAIDSRKNTIYLADENTMSVYELSKNEKKLNKIVNISIPKAAYNRGLEGLTCGRDTLYIANQSEPCRLFKYSTVNKKIISLDLPYATFLSDIFYDETDNTLWIIDSKQYKITHCKLNGKIIAQQDIPMVRKAEGLCVDRNKKIAWIGCDKTGNLYRIKLKI